MIPHTTIKIRRIITIHYRWTLDVWNSLTSSHTEPFEKHLEIRDQKIAGYFWGRHFLGKVFLNLLCFQFLIWHLWGRFFRGTHPCQDNNSKAIRDIEKRFFVSFTQVNLWYGKLFVFFQVNRFTGNWFLNRKFRSSNLSRHNFVRLF